METTINTVTDFREFIHSKDSEYRDQIGSLALFQPQTTGLWSDEDKQRFASVFYHIRGYFIQFMWYVANFSSDDTVKSILMDNIKEELGVGGKKSHEQLYSDFAVCCNVDIQDEIVNQTNYLPFAKAYNKDHMVWLKDHSSNARLAAFAAYERLDNIDYDYLYQLSDSLALSKEGSLFFKVHTLVEHYEPTEALLKEMWLENKHDVIDSFEFIYNHQLNMWRQLSDYIFTPARETLKVV
jgi:hypothetical protein